MGQYLRQVGSVFKLRIGLAITFSAMAGLAVTPGPLPPAWKIAVLALAVLLSSASAGAFNQYVERDLDARMDRTRGRPFVTGAFRAGFLWPTVILLVLAVAVAMAVWALNVHVAIYLFLGAFVYGVVYTVWLKQRSSLNIVLGGLSGSFAVLAGAAAVNPSLTAAPIILAIVLFLWTPPHFWSLATVLHRQYAAAGVPMLPVVIGDAAAARVALYHTVALVTLSLAPVFFGLGWIYFAGAATGGAYFLYKSVALVRNPCAAAAAENFRASLIQLSLLQLGAVVDRLALG